MNIIEKNLDQAKERFKNASQPFAQTTAEDIANLSGPHTWVGDLSARI